MVEPVERLCRGDDIGRAVEERNRLGASLKRMHRRQGCRELGAHLVERLDRDDAMAERDEHTRQLPCSGAEVDDGERPLADHPANR